MRKLLILLSIVSFSTEAYDKQDPLNQGCPVMAFSSSQGNIPLLLTNEHGANRNHFIESIPEREGNGVAKFIKLADQYTDVITEELAQEIEQISGYKPYLLIAEIPRSQIDFNRPNRLAYELYKMKHCYEDFHVEAQRLVSEIKDRWGRGYLLDVHGQSKFPDKIIRGTRNGLTIKELRKRMGDDEYKLKNSLFGQLSAKEYPVMPKGSDEEKFYIGGYMLKKYGSQNASGIDAVQIEIGREFRVDETKKNKLIKDLAQSLVYRLENLQLINP